MKKRKGFVSNSSSCSFTCKVCGREEEGHNLEYEEVDMLRFVLPTEDESYWDYYYTCVDHIDQKEITINVSIEDLLNYPFLLKENVFELIVYNLIKDKLEVKGCQ